MQRYVVRLYRLSGRVVTLPEWLEPLWKLWAAGRGEQLIEEEDLTKNAAKALNRELFYIPLLKISDDLVKVTVEPMPFAPPNELITLQPRGSSSALHTLLRR